MARAFDETELLDRVDNDVAFLAETVEMLRNDGPMLIEQIKGALASGDTAAAGRHGHTLKGMLSNFCAPGVQARAFEIEKSGKAGDRVAISAAVAGIEPELASLIAELGAFVAEKS